MSTPGDVIRRFSVSDRAEHWVQMISFTVLAVTGLVQRYDGAWISEKLISGMSGIEVVRDIHRVFATLLMLAVVYHFGSAFYRKYVLDRPRSMVPGATDARAIALSVKYIFGRSDRLPAQGRFTWEEKVEYWAFVWGTVIMVVTGFLLWNPIATTRFLPGQWVPTAKVVHGGEATLAVLAVIVWHTYHVHFGHFNKSMFTGKMSRGEMVEFHPLELASIEAGAYPLPPVEERRRRLTRFIPIYGFMSVVLLVGVYLFVTFEDTNIATVRPPEQVQVFAPVETLPPGAVTTTIAPATTTTTAGGPTTTAVPAEVTWDGVVSVLFNPGCTGCHGASLQSGGLDLSSYDSALTGGGSGPGIVPNDAAASIIVQKMESGAHPAVLSAEDISLLRAWIDNGAAESTSGGGTTDTTVAAGDTWDSAVAAFFNPTCTGCHGTTGGIDLSSYDTALAGGASGAGVVPGDAAGSAIVLKMEAGNHPGMLTDDELARLRAWIDSGAAES
jgi:formate dehydrogenase gamma subunit